MSHNAATDAGSENRWRRDVTAPLARVLDGALGRVRSLLRGPAGTQRDPRQARLLPGATPATLEERLIADTLAGAELGVDAVIDAVSAALYRHELENGGRAAELCLFGSRVFVPDVLHVLEVGEGRLWTLSGAPAT